MQLLSPATRDRMRTLRVKGPCRLLFQPEGSKSTVEAIVSGIKKRIQAGVSKSITASEQLAFDLEAAWESEPDCCEICAGGPGSGCHGPNCGRPALPKVPALLKQHGWKLDPEAATHISQHPNPHKKYNVYVHPTLGTLHVSHDGFKHFNKQGGLESFKVAKSSFTKEMGVPLNKALDDHINSLKGNKPEQTSIPMAPSGIIGPPEGMSLQYKSASGQMFSWNQDTQKYDHSSQNTNLAISKETTQTLFEQGHFTPVGLGTPKGGGSSTQSPPGGLPATLLDTYGRPIAKGGAPTSKTDPYSYEKPKSAPDAYLLPHATSDTPKGAEIKYDSASKAYVNQHTGEVLTLKDAKQHLAEISNSWQARPSGPPRGMPDEVKGPKGGKYAWNDAEQKYTHGSGKYSLTTDQVKSKLDSGNMKVTKGEYKLATPTEKAVTSPDAWSKPTTTPADTGTIKSPTVSTTPVPGSMAITLDQFTFKESGKGLGGAHDKYVYSDKNGNDWLFKPATTLSGAAAPVMAHADEAVSRIAQALRPGYAVEAKAMAMVTPDGKQQFGSLQKMIPTSVLRGKDGQYKDFTGRNFDTHPLADWESKSLQQERVLDWLISNHDSHGAQFLRTSGQYVGSRSVIGIDKTQAFKYFGSDKLSTDYHPNASYGEKPPIYNAMYQAVKDGKVSIDPKDALDAIKKAEGISKQDYVGILKPYADARFGSDNSGKQQFLDAAASRKENLRSDFEKFYGDVLHQPGFKFEPPEPVYDPNSKAVVNWKGGQKKEELPDHEERPNHQATIQAALPALMAKYSNGANDLNLASIDKWQSAYNKTDPTLPENKRWEQAAKNNGLYPELAAKVGLLPSDLTNVHSAISDWSSTTSSGGASNIRAGAQDVINAGPQDKLKSRFSAALQIEHEVTKAKLAQIYPSKTMDMYRGLSAKVAEQLKNAKKQAGIVEYHTMGAEGWTNNESTASSFGGYSSGVTLHISNMPIDNAITSYKTSPDPHHHLSEHETFMAFPGKVQYLKAHEILGAIMAGIKKIVIDGTDQWHGAIPPDWKGPGAQVPVEVVDFELCDKDGKLLTSRDVKASASAWDVAAVELAKLKKMLKQ